MNRLQQTLESKLTQLYGILEPLQKLWDPTNYHNDFFEEGKTNPEIRKRVQEIHIKSCT